MLLRSAALPVLLSSFILPLIAAAPVRNEAAIQEVAGGKRAAANAAWWGFDPEDSTAAIQAAIDSGARTVVIPFAGAPWIVRPMKLRGNLELLLEPGVLLLARKGEFRGGGDSMFTADGISNLTIRGYGATLRMRKKDYQNPPYQKAEWRMGIAIRGCRNVLIEGLRVESTGGDGFYVDGGSGLAYSEHVTIRNCTSHDNHRQGISVISAQDLLVENCTFSGTKGTAPEAGIDLEPDSGSQRLVNCVIRNCLFENNHGHQILVYLKQFSSNTEPVSIRFENCHSRGTPSSEQGEQGWAGMAIGAVRDDGPRGTIEFIDCTAQDTGREGLKVYNKSADRLKLRFRNCAWSNPWNSPAPDYGGLRVPVLLSLSDPKVTVRPGGVEFEDCRIYDRVRRRPVAAFEDTTDFGFRDIRGLITVHGASLLPVKLGPAAAGVDLKVVKE